MNENKAIFIFRDCNYEEMYTLTTVRYRIYLLGEGKKMMMMMSSRMTWMMMMDLMVMESGDCFVSSVAQTVSYETTERQYTDFWILSIYLHTTLCIFAIPASKMQGRVKIEVSYKILGVQLNNWTGSDNTEELYRKGQCRMFYLVCVLGSYRCFTSLY